MNFLTPFLGGTLIGFASLLLLHFNGRILGISGIIGGTLKRNSESKLWRHAFLLGLIVGGFFIYYFNPLAFQFTLNRSYVSLAIAGLLVGYGTRLGGGCTSGHGVCGMGRFSVRSIAATTIFMFFGALTVFIINHFLGGQI